MDAECLYEERFEAPAWKLDWRLDRKRRFSRRNDGEMAHKIYLLSLTGLPVRSELGDRLESHRAPEVVDLETLNETGAEYTLKAGRNVPCKLENDISRGTPRGVEAGRKTGWKTYCALERGVHLESLHELQNGSLPETEFEAGGGPGKEGRVGIRRRVQSVPTMDKEPVARLKVHFGPGPEQGQDLMLVETQ